MTSGLRFKEIESIKNFEYPVACTGVCIAPNQKRVITIGIYKPSVKSFDLGSMTMRFERHIVADPLKVVSLTDDAEKFAVLRNDRCLEFHSRNGLHDQAAVPCQPKEILFNPISSELYSSGDYDCIYRFNLEQGRFLREIEVPGIRSMAFSGKHGLLLGVSEQSVHFIDSRTKSDVLARKETGDELLCIDVCDNGLNYAVGNAGGLLREYDIRSSGCIYKEEFTSHITKIKYNGKHILCAVQSNIHVSTEERRWASIDAEFPINDFDVNGGLLVLGGEYEDMKCYFSNGLGPVASWCSNIVFD